MCMCMYATLGAAHAPLLRLLRARLAALGSLALPGEEVGPLRAQPLLGLERAVSADLAGSRRISPDLAAVGAWHHPGPPNYPEVTCGVLIINAPRFASAAWAIVGPLLPQATRDKVSVLSPALILAP